MWKWEHCSSHIAERRYLLKEFPELVHCDDSAKVLEVGCGNGSTDLPILRRGSSKLKRERPPILSEKAKVATNSKKEIPHKICVRNDDNAKYMSYIKRASTALCHRRCIGAAPFLQPGRRSGFFAVRLHPAAATPPAGGAAVLPAAAGGVVRDADGRSVFEHAFLARPQLGAEQDDCALEADSP